MLRGPGCAWSRGRQWVHLVRVDEVESRSHCAVPFVVVHAAQVTAVLYLNPQWEKGDGGELRLYPFPLGTVDVAPRMDRLVLFNSTEMLHRVLPATAPRVCLSVWFARDGGSNRMSLPCRLPRAVAEDEGGGMLKFLLQPSNRKVLTKIVYANAWAESFEDAFGTGPEVQEALALNRADSKAATSTISAELLDLVRECLPIPVPPELATPVVCEEPQPTPSLGGTTPEPAPTALARVPLVAHAATHPAAPATSGAQPGAQRPAALDVMGGTFGGMYSDAFIATVRPLYDLHMGVETMAPLLYALIRFTKPTIVMEIGAGYTTPFMLQALKDNYTEITHLRSLHQVGKCVVEVRWQLANNTLPSSIMRDEPPSPFVFLLSTRRASLTRELGDAFRECHGVSRAR